MENKVIHEAKYQQFTIALDGEDEAELAYALPENGIIDFTHTYVPAGERGQGLANTLIETGLDYAEERELRVIATCPVVAKYIKRHSKYQKLLAPE